MIPKAHFYLCDDTIHYPVVLRIHILTIFSFFFIVIAFYSYNLLLSVLGVDYIEKGNLTELPVPKYNNKVQNPNMTDKTSHITIPTANLKKKSMKGESWVQTWELMENQAF